MWMLNFYMYENVWEHGQHTGSIQAKPLHPHSYLLFGPELIKHFLDLHTPVVLHAVERVLGHGGHHRFLNGWQLLQDAGKRRTHMGVLVPTLWRHMTAWTSPTDWPNQTFTLASGWLYPPWAWQKVQGRWRGLVGLIYWQPHRKPQLDHLSHDTAPPQLATPTAGHHSWGVEWNGKRETGNNIV